MSNTRLIHLYKKTSKHSQYQVLSNAIKELIPNNIVNIQSRHEEERLDYILKHIPHKNINLVDIGANTGYFSLELIGRGINSALVIEGNKTHSDFVQEAITALNWEKQVEVRSCYIEFDKTSLPLNTNVTLLLNILHHVGDDYGDQKLSIDAAKNSILDSLSYLAKQTPLLIFQLGFNWKGNPNLPLFENGTKEEMIEFIKKGTEDSWQIKNIGIAEKPDNRVSYHEINAKNIQRIDSLGEFLNRPIFIMQSRLYNHLH